MKNIALRLASEGGALVEKDFDRVGRGAEAAMKRVVASTRPASEQLKLFTATAAQGGGGNLSQQLDALFGSRSAQVRDRAEDVAAYGAELDRLRAKFNPLFAVSQRYEKELEEIAQAEKLGAISAMEAGMARERAAERMRPMSDATEELRRGFMGLNSGAIQNASFQLGDFAVQVGGGVAPATALAQQLPQLLGAFGMWGAVAGAAVAIGAPLAAAFFSSGEEAASLTDRTEELENASRNLAAAQRDLGQSSEDLATTYGVHAAAAEGVIQRLADLEAVRFEDSVRAQGEAIASMFGDVSAEAERMADSINQTTMMTGGWDQLETTISRVADSLGVSETAARPFLEALRDIEQAQASGSVEDLAAASDRAAAALEAATGGVGNMNAETQLLYENLNKTASSAYAGAAGIDAVGDAAARSATQIASARDAYVQFQAEMARAEAQEKARLEGRTSGLAATEDSRTSQVHDSQSVPYEVRVAQQRAEEAEARKASNKARSAAESEAKKAARELEREEEQRRKVIEGLEYERAAFDAGGLSRQVYSATQRANVDLYSEEGQNIAWLILQTQGLKDEMERIDEVNQFVGKSLSGLFKGALEGADGFNDALGELSGRLANMAIDTAFQSFLGAMGGTGGVGGTAAGGLLTTIFGIGKRARGGPVRAGQPYIVGEEQEELFVPDQAGTILPHVPRVASGGGSQRIKVDVAVSVDGSGELQAYVRNVSTAAANQAMDGARASFRDGVNRAIADPRMRGVR